jgi:hypothetical protein
MRLSWKNFEPDSLCSYLLFKNDLLKVSLKAGCVCSGLSIKVIFIYCYCDGHLMNESSRFYSLVVSSIWSSGMTLSVSCGVDV